MEVLGMIGFGQVKVMRRLFKMWSMIHDDAQCYVESHHWQTPNPGSRRLDWLAKMTLHLILHRTTRRNRTWTTGSPSASAAKTLHRLLQLRHVPGPLKNPSCRKRPSERETAPGQRHGGLQWLSWIHRACSHLGSAPPLQPWRIGSTDAMSAKPTLVLGHRIALPVFPLVNENGLQMKKTTFLDLCSHWILSLGSCAPNHTL